MPDSAIVMPPAFTRNVFVGELLLFDHDLNEARAVPRESQALLAVRMDAEDVKLIDVQNDLGHFADVHFSDGFSSLRWYLIHGHCPASW
jgi:hypothetical protein